MPAGIRGRARRGSVVVLAGLVAATVLGACAGKNCTGSAGPTTPPAVNPNDLAGCGGRVDQIYNELYTPGDPSWSQF